MVWVALCNIAAIIIGFLWVDSYSSDLPTSSGLTVGLIIAINVTSLVMLLPLIKMDPIKPFLVPALIWFAMLVIVYSFIGMYILLILAVVQLAADLWFTQLLKKV